MNDEQLLRYSRHIMLPEIEIEGQDKIINGKVAVIGLGGLGSPIAVYLASSGIGQLILVDDDVVDQSNLQRQIAHGESDIGHAKVESARETVKRLNSDTEVTTVNHRLDADELRNLCNAVDAVVDATDNFSTRYAINEACLSTKTPLVSGAAIRMEGQISVFDFRNSDSPCYRCLYQDGADEELNCAQNGVVAPLVGVVGCVQAMETLKVVAGFGETLAGWVLYFDAKRMDWRKFKLNKNPNCPSCGSTKSIDSQNS